MLTLSFPSATRFSVFHPQPKSFFALCPDSCPAFLSLYCFLLPVFTLSAVSQRASLHPNSVVQDTESLSPRNQGKTPPFCSRFIYVPFSDSLPSLFPRLSPKFTVHCSCTSFSLFVLTHSHFHLLHLLCWLLLPVPSFLTCFLLPFPAYFLLPPQPAVAILLVLLPLVLLA